MCRTSTDGYPVPNTVICNTSSGVGFGAPLSCNAPPPSDDRGYLFLQVGG